MKRNETKEITFQVKDGDRGNRCPVNGRFKGRSIEANSFSLSPPSSQIQEVEAFLGQMHHERGNEFSFEERWSTVKKLILENGYWDQNYEELVYGARLAWRNSVRCVGRMFWSSLNVFDARHAKTTNQMFESILQHLDWATNDGDLRPAITIFRAHGPKMRVINDQLILYAGYQKNDGKIIGDPKNIQITKLATALGWRGEGTQFDILPLILQIGDQPPAFYEIPKEYVLEVEITHPEVPEFANLNLRWFAVPAVASMALDLGGIQYTAAPSSGIYQGTEIGSFNLGDPRRYDVLPKVAKILKLDQTHQNPMWRDQALVELNRAVLYSFKKRKVRIMDHHNLSESFFKFCNREKRSGREVYGHWPWIVPPMSSNLSWIWHDKTFKKKIIKPNYFYQKLPSSLEGIVRKYENDSKSMTDEMSTEHA